MTNPSTYRSDILSCALILLPRVRPCSSTRLVDGSLRKASLTSSRNFAKTPASNDTSHRTCCDIPSRPYCCATELTFEWFRNSWATLRSPRRSATRTLRRIIWFRSCANGTLRLYCAPHKRCSAPHWTRRADLVISAPPHCVAHSSRNHFLEVSL